MKKTKTILWAVDVTKNRPELLRKAAHLLGQWTKGQSVRIEPVYVLQPQDPALAAAVLPLASGTLEEKVEVLLHEKLRLFRGISLEKPTLVVSKKRSLKAVIETLLQYAKENQAELIVIHSTRKGAVDRLLLGSFAESLTAQCQVPVLVVARGESVKPLHTILFPTDFSHASHTVLQRILEDQRNAKPKIVLFHQLEMITSDLVEPFWQPTVSQLYTQQVEKCKKTGALWLKEIRRKGFRAQFLLGNDMRGKGPAIVDCATHEKAGVIAMASHTESELPLFWGTTTKYVLRHATVPVWALHPARRAKVVPLRRKVKRTRIAASVSQGERKRA